SAVINTAVLAASVGLTGLLPPPVLGVAVAYTAIPSVLRALTALREGRVGVDALDVVAIGISVASGRFATAALITWLCGLGDFILPRTQAKARGAIRARLDPDEVEAHRLVGDATSVERIAAGQLSLGDRIIVDTGMRLPADGVVVSGAALVDEKALTGE